MSCEEPAYARSDWLRTRWGRIWYGVAGTGSGAPVLTLHGGPGVPHYYFARSMGRLGEERPVVFYHQLGCGRSDRPSDRTLWTAERFAAELAEVVEGLEVAGVLGRRGYHLWGHSWGTMLAVLHALGRPPRLRSLTLASPILDMPRYRADLDRLVAGQPPAVQSALRDHPVDSPEYAAALDRFYRTHLYRAAEWDPCTLQAFSPGQFGRDSYLATVGPSELAYTGNLRDRDDSARLGELAVPALLIVGRDDIATPERAAAYQARLPGSRLEVLDDSSHWYFEERPSPYLALLRAFLARHD